MDSAEITLLIDDLKSLGYSKNAINKSLLEATGEEWVFAEDKETFILKSEAKFDDLSEEWYSLAADFEEVKSRCINTSDDCILHTYILHVEQYAFFCDHTDIWYDNNYYEVVDVEGVNVCLEACSHLLYSWDSDGEYHWEEEEEEENDDEDDYDGVPGYHSVTRPANWTEILGIGVELEVFSPNRRQLYKSLPSGIFGETDGSLCDEHGIELVGAPFEFREYSLHSTPWTPTISKVKELGATGFDPYNSDDQYGMHISLSRKLFTDLHAAKFILFLNMYPRLCKLIAGRENFYEGSYQARRKIKDCVRYVDKRPSLFERSVHDKKNKNRDRKIMTNKYEAVYAADNRLEVRIFQSTVNYDDFMKNIEFVEAVKEWTNLKYVTSAIVSRNTKSMFYKQGTELFFDWLNDQDAYPHLKKFLHSNNSSPIRGINKVKVEIPA